MNMTDKNPCQRGDSILVDKHISNSANSTTLDSYTYSNDVMGCVWGYGTTFEEVVREGVSEEVTFELRLEG